MILYLVLLLYHANYTPAGENTCFAMHLFASCPFPIDVHVCMLSVAKYIFIYDSKFCIFEFFQFFTLPSIETQRNSYFFGFTVFIKYPRLQGQKSPPALLRSINN